MIVNNNTTGPGAIGDGAIIATQCWLDFSADPRYLSFMSEELDVLKAVAANLNKANIPYMVSGSVAMNFHAQPRMTRDIDIVVVLGQSDIEHFVSAFKEEFYLDEETIKEEVKRRGMFNLIHNKYIVKIDFIVQKGDEFSQSAFGRRLEIDLDGVKVYIASAEDLILAKLNWAKGSMSEMQLRDVANIKNMAGNLDQTYLNNWIKRLELQEIYKKVV